MPNESNDLFGPIKPAESTKRFVARPTHRDWSLSEDASLVPVLLACESERSYLESARVLCEIHNRIPVFGPDARPTVADRVRESQDLIERRTITGLLGGMRPDAPKFQSRLFGGFRTGLPLTWAEHTKFLTPYARKPQHKQPRITSTELLALLERGIDDEDMILTRLADIKRGLGSVDGNLSAPRPCGVNTVERTRIHIRRFLATDPADDDMLRLAWRWLCESFTKRD